VHGFIYNSSTAKFTAHADSCRHELIFIVGGGVRRADPFFFSGGGVTENSAARPALHRALLPFTVQ